MGTTMTDPEQAPPDSWRLDDAAWAFFAAIDRVSGDGLVLWRWRATGTNGVVWNGNDTFASSDACKADASTHGYVQQDPA